MREIIIGEQQLRIRATPLALLYYKQAFKSDIVADLIKIIAGLAKIIPGLTGKKLTALDSSKGSVLELDASEITMDNLGMLEIDTVNLLQIIWAMAKADSFGSSKEFPCFEFWVSSLEDFNVFDSKMLSGVIEEATDGLFRRGNKSPAKK